MTLTFTSQAAGRDDNDHQISATLTGVQAAGVICYRLSGGQG